MKWQLIRGRSPGFQRGGVASRSKEISFSGGKDQLWRCNETSGLWMSKLDARCWSRTWTRLRAIFSSRRNFYQLTKDSDKSSKQFKEKFNHTQSNHFNYCPVPQQKYQIRYHHCCPRFHHRVVLSVASATKSYHYWKQLMAKRHFLFAVQRSGTV